MNGMRYRDVVDLTRLNMCESEMEGVRSSYCVEGIQTDDFVPFTVLVWRKSQSLRNRSGEKVDACFNIGRCIGMASETTGKGIPRIGNRTASVRLIVHKLLNRDGIGWVYPR